jgi:hypothetical protein
MAQCPFCTVNAPSHILPKHLWKAHRSKMLERQRAGQPVTAAATPSITEGSRQVKCPLCHTDIDAPAFDTHVKEKHPQAYGLGSKALLDQPDSLGETVETTERDKGHPHMLHDLAKAFKEAAPCASEDGHLPADAAEQQAVPSKPMRSPLPIPSDDPLEDFYYPPGHLLNGTQDEVAARIAQILTDAGEKSANRGSPYLPRMPEKADPVRALSERLKDIERTRLSRRWLVWGSLLEVRDGVLNLATMRIERG